VHLNVDHLKIGLAFSRGDTLPENVIEDNSLRNDTNRCISPVKDAEHIKAPLSLIWSERGLRRQIY
jgi:hypothetical protein